MKKVVAILSIICLMAAFGTMEVDAKKTKSKGKTTVVKTKKNSKGKKSKSKKPKALKHKKVRVSKKKGGGTSQQYYNFPSGVHPICNFDFQDAVFTMMSNGTVTDTYSEVVGKFKYINGEYRIHLDPQSRAGDWNLIVKGNHVYHGGHPVEPDEILGVAVWVK